MFNQYCSHVSILTSLCCLCTFLNSLMPLVYIFYTFGAHFSFFWVWVSIHVISLYSKELSSACLIMKVFQRPILCFYKKIIFTSLFLKDIFAGCRILGWHYFRFTTLKILLHSLLSSCFWWQVSHNSQYRFLCLM